MTEPKVKPRDKPHYVNNALFSAAVVEYVAIANTEIEKGNAAPVIPNYIAECFLKISEGLSHKSNFVRYTYREEMVMDAVENCLKAIKNYNIEAATRTGKPNAFSYFTQISWFAFLRRIKKEKDQQDIKMKYMSSSGYEDYISDGGELANGHRDTSAFVDQLRDRIDRVKAVDTSIKQTGPASPRKRRANKVDSDLSGFIS
jgi:hypothetical protein